MKKENRFKVIFKDGSQLKDEGQQQILVDTETGVNYLIWHNGYAGSIRLCLMRMGSRLSHNMWNTDGENNRNADCFMIFLL